MAEQTRGYPIFSEKAWWALRKYFRGSVPGVVSINYIKTQLSMNGKNSAYAVIASMKRLGLIDDDGIPTELAKEWRLDDKYKQVCDKIVKHTYPPELLDIFTATEVDKDKATNWFMRFTSREDLAGKMAALFALLKSGEIKEKQDKENTPNTNVKKIKVNTNKSPNQTTLLNSRPNLHIDLQIHISPDSTPEQIDKIFVKHG